MFVLVWKERLMGVSVVKSKVFKDRAERFKFILRLEKSPYFVKVLEITDREEVKQK